jgi:hypothetical protein
VIERLSQGLRLHDVGVDVRMTDRPDTPGEAILIDMDNQLQAQLPSAAVPERDHVAELPGGIDMQQWKRRLRRIEGFQGEVQED